MKLIIILHLDLWLIKNLPRFNYLLQASQLWTYPVEYAVKFAYIFMISFRAAFESLTYAYRKLGIPSGSDSKYRTIYRFWIHDAIGESGARSSRSIYMLKSIFINDFNNFKEIYNSMLYEYMPNLCMSQDDSHLGLIHSRRGIILITSPHYLRMIISSKIIYGHQFYTKKRM